MRLGEACQLTEDDIAEVAGFSVFRIYPTDDDSKRVKTKAGERVIPVHPELEKLGFFDFVCTARRVRTSGSRLFPELPIGTTGYVSDPFSKWFARFLDHVGITHERKNFHSFRHNFRDALRAANVPTERARLLGGWSDDSTDASYGGAKEVAAAMLGEEIGKVHFKGLDLTHLIPR